MIRAKIFQFFFLLSSLSVLIVAQTTSYTAYQTSFPVPTSCLATQYFDTALLQCSPCPSNASTSTDFTQCNCPSSFYYGVNQGGGSVTCLSCTSGTQTSDGFGCRTNVATCVSTSVLTESNIDGSLVSGTASNAQPRIGDAPCTPCANGTIPDAQGQRCSPCADITPQISVGPGATVTCCATSALKDGICLTQIINTGVITETPNYQNRFASPFTSKFVQERLDAAVYLCRMNLASSTVVTSPRLLQSNATACQVLGNIAAMQLFYGLNGYAYSLYDDYIWQSQRTSIWTTASIRWSIPFLAFPSTFYQEITSTSYSWIPTTFQPNDLVTMKFAKYSPLGQYLGLVDGFDAQIQLCGGAYSDGRSAFTFGSQFQKTCTIRPDALWSSPMYETAFYDPYLVFVQSSVSYMIPASVVIYNYQSTSGSLVNQNTDESQWVYHRRFFLLDRISGVDTNGQLQNVRYAQSIQLIQTLTNDNAYLAPPVLVITYAQLSTGDLGGTPVQVTFTSQYRMNLNSQIQGIWIAVGVLSALGIFMAFFRTTVWQTRSGRQIIDLMTIFKALLYVCNIIAGVFFIVMAGVSVWWLVFFKTQAATYLVLPTTLQQASFTALVVIAFALKTFDIIHLIIRQSMVDIFFIDWEKPKEGYTYSVSVWRSYFVANEFNEIQTFRRINLTFHLLFVLFLLKVINLENIAVGQPSTNLFPSPTDVQAEFNGILRVGIAFSMWAATGIFLYIFYAFFYRRFIEDRLLNFIDLCSVSNISVFMLIFDLYGYYLHGRSPHGTTDVNMREMIWNLERESKGTIGSRGLTDKTAEQTFIVKVDPSFRKDYASLLMSYQTKITPGRKDKITESEAENSMTAYRNLNEFLCAFINHSLVKHNYVIRARSFLDKLLNYEFQGGVLVGAPEQMQNILFVDEEKNFANVFFYGYEFSLLMWNMATFLFVDYFAFNYVLAAVVTYLLNLIAVKLRQSLGRKNLAVKTHIPRNFLI